MRQVFFKHIQFEIQSLFYQAFLKPIGIHRVDVDGFLAHHPF